ncbi:MAG: Pirin-related protein [Idiomarinaceae bacterium HL-53]|nr:MAG: Pirin-related protein [Idiomarinaceae bacterium HL-53]CUS49253.1 hypothetical protein Ga0003345_2241 [Idiomarinaceae bacterium HL-53]
MSKLTSKAANLTEEIEVFRIIPQKQRRTVGPFCFLDHFGPTPERQQITFDVAPHPHIGLQTLSWLWQGEILHLDSLGTEQWLFPNQVNLMTAGSGISHAEVIPQDHTQHMHLHGAQIWLALPPDKASIDPAFEHISQLPELAFGSFKGHLILGTLGPQQVQATIYSELVAFDLLSTSSGTAQVPLEDTFEYLVYVVESSPLGISINGSRCRAHEAFYIEPGTSPQLHLAGQGRILVLGGTPYPAPLRMFWNFVANDNGALHRAATAWNADDAQFGEVKQYAKYGKGPERLLSPEPPASFLSRG